MITKKKKKGIGLLKQRDFTWWFIAAKHLSLVSTQLFSVLILPFGLHAVVKLCANGRRKTEG